MSVTEVIYLAGLGVIFSVLAVLAIRDTSRVARRAEMLELLDEYAHGIDASWRDTLDDINDLPEVAA